MEGRAVASSTFLVRPGELGWDGSLDGTYHVYPSFSAMFNFNTSAGAALFTRALAGDYSHLDPPFIRVSGGTGSPQNTGAEFQHGRRHSRRSKPKRPVDPRPACDKFAEQLASRLWQAVAVDGGYNPNSRHDLANEMRNQAIDDVDLNGFRYTKRVYPIDGFKSYLTDNGQDADVYHHISFTAGNALHGTPGGDAENAAFRAYDWKQAVIDGRAESETELRDDDAGVAVGGLMLNTALAGKSGDYWGLKAQIKGVLCDH